MSSENEAYETGFAEGQAAEAQTTASESALNDLLCDFEINESCDYYGIPVGDGQYYMQRKHELSGSDRPIESGEKVMIKLCKALINTNKLIEKLNDKYGT